MPVPKPSAADAEEFLRKQFKAAVDRIQITIDTQLTHNIECDPKAEVRFVYIDPYERGMGQPYQKEAVQQALEAYDDWETSIENCTIRTETGAHMGWKITFK